jgi:DNA-binding response OmpR family regulator
MAEIQENTLHTGLIFIIDDSLTVRKIIETCLKRAGFDVQGFPDGIEAIRWLNEPGSSVPDLVILDIGLPRLDGYKVARRLKTKPQCSNMVIIMVSRRDGMIDKLKGRLAGAKDYLTKPFKTQELLSMIDSHIHSAVTRPHG